MRKDTLSRVAAAGNASSAGAKAQRPEGSVRKVKVPAKPGDGALQHRRCDLRARKGAFGDYRRGLPRGSSDRSPEKRRCQRPARGTPPLRIFETRAAARWVARLFSASCLEAHSRAAH